MQRIHTPAGPGIADAYERDVLPALAERLDQAFPEFGWQPDAQGWKATNDDYTHTAYGVRAERIICHGAAPRGFYIYGERPVLWTTHVNHDQPARGRAFIDAVRDIARRAGVELDTTARPLDPRQRRSDLLHDAFVLCRRELASDRSVDARSYLTQQRGIPPDRIERTRLGVVPPFDRLRTGLRAAGYNDREIHRSGLLHDNRWPGRICGDWRDERGRVITIWARATEPADAQRYLYLHGASRTNAPPYGLFDILASGSIETRRDVVIVEGVLDVHHLRAHDITNVIALGGTSVHPDLFQRLADLGIGRITLCLDSDEAGRQATRRCLDVATYASTTPDVFVARTTHVGGTKDPGELLQAQGLPAWCDLLERRQCGVAWRAEDLCGNVAATSSLHERREALRLAGSWLGGLPERYAIEQDAAILILADRLAYAPEPIRRSFRARYWHVHDRAPDHGACIEIDR